MKYLKKYEKVFRELRIGDYILYSGINNDYYILNVKYIARFGLSKHKNIILKPIYQIRNNLYYNDKRSKLTWNNGLESLLENTIYYNDNLEDVVNYLELLISTKKYNI